MKDNSSTRKFAVVTGASSGIGFDLARQFAQHNFELLIAAEDECIAEAARRLVESGVAVEALQVDLAQFEGVENCTPSLNQVDGRSTPSPSTLVQALHAIF